MKQLKESFFIVALIVLPGLFLILMSACSDSSGRTTPVTPQDVSFRFNTNGLLGTLSLSETTSGTDFSITSETTVKTLIEHRDTPYAFTITDMPPHQTCRIDNPTGTTGPDQTTITIQCTTHEYGGRLKGKRIALSPGHGYTYDPLVPGWRYQRAIHCDLREDTFTQEMVINHLLPAFERAGAQVISMRERVKDGGMVVIDDAWDAYSDTDGWEDGPGGYMGHHRLLTVTASEEQAEWTIEVDSSGTYSLYVHYIQNTENASNVYYQLTHAGGTTSFFIDQSHWAYQPSTETSAAAIWYPVGNFYFHQGDIYGLVVSSLGSDPGKTIVADAIRLGGGMGTVTVDGEPSGAASWEEDALTFLTSLAVPDWILTNDVTCRPNYALYLGADAFISVHANSYDTVMSGSRSVVWGTEMAGGIPNEELLPPGTMAFATGIHTRLIDRIRADWDIDWTDHGIDAANFGELRPIQNAWASNSEYSIPAVLLELGFLDHCANDALLLGTTGFRHALARAVVKGTIDYFFEGHAIYPPMPVKNLSVALEDDRITLSWEAQEDSLDAVASAAEYYFIYSSDEGIIFTAPPISTAHTGYAFALSETTHRYFKVTAFNASGESVDSEIVHAE